MKRSPFFLFFCFVVLGFTANGAPIYDNGAPEQTDGFEMTEYIQADDFTLDALTVLGSVTFWDLESGSGFQGVIQWQIYSNTTKNSPGTLLYSGFSLTLSRMATGLSSSGYAEYANSFDITPVALQPGTYWLALHNGTQSNNAYRYIFWETTRHIGSRASQSNQTPFNGPWYDNLFRPRVTAFEYNKGAPRISFSTISKQNYRVDFKNTLADVSWTAVPGADMLIGTGAGFQVTDSDPAVASSARRFYRVQTASDLAFQLFTPGGVSAARVPSLVSPQAREIQSRSNEN